jgi:hypothetical protein
MGGVTTLMFVILISGSISFYLSIFAWWSPLIAFPVLMGFGGNFVGPETDKFMMLIVTAWRISALVICVLGLGYLWGLLLGFIVGVIGAVLFVPNTAGQH